MLLLLFLQKELEMLLLLFLQKELDAANLRPTAAAVSSLGRREASLDAHAAPAQAATSAQRLVQSNIHVVERTE